MSLRQRTWAIYVRPWYETTTATDEQLFIPYTGRIIAMEQEVSPCSPCPGEEPGIVQLKGDEFGEVGAWAVYYRTNSFHKIREVYNIILEFYSTVNIRVVEEVDMNTIVTPLT